MDLKEILFDLITVSFKDEQLRERIKEEKSQNSDFNVWIKSKINSIKALTENSPVSGASLKKTDIFGMYFDIFD